MNLDTSNPGLWLRIGWFSSLTVTLLDFAVTLYLGSLLPHYNPLIQTESYLGRTGQITAPYIALWGAIFTGLFLFVARAWYQFFPEKSKLVLFSTTLLVLYGLGEGLGSGLVHFNQIHGITTWSGTLHQLISSTADVALFVFPLAVMALFSRAKHPGLHLLSWTTLGLGLLINVIFLIGKTYGFQHGLFSWLGLWQRLFLLDYYTYLIFIHRYLFPIDRKSGK